MARLSVKTNGAALDILTQLAKKQTVKAGWLSGKSYPSGISVAEVAIVQEYGSPQNNIPPRAPLRKTIANHQATWRALTAGLAKRMAKGSMTNHAMMEALGGVVAGDIRLTFTQITDPPLKPATVKARARRYLSPSKKGSPSSGITKPLIDSAVMMNSVTHEVGEP